MCTPEVAAPGILHPGASAADIIAVERGAKREPRSKGATVYLVVDGYSFQASGGTNPMNVELLAPL